MQILGEKVKHIKYGVGTVVEQKDACIVVEFAKETKKFVYPDAFEKFLTAENEIIHKSILNEIFIIKEQKENAKQTKYASVVTKEVVSKVDKTTFVQKSKKEKKQTRLSGQIETFFVFQGNTFDKESKDGYLWAPISNKSEQSFHHWDRLMDVRENDIIFHGCDGFICAVSQAKGKCYECIQPEELRTEKLWDLEGRKVECNYIYIKNPLKTSMLKDEIIQFCSVKYAPFDKHGNGNMGYLYELSKKLAHIFMNILVNDNQYLLKYEWIQKFLEEM